MLWMAAPVWAHGIGGRGDLPVPLSFFVIGAGAAVVVSFVALTLLWSQPRLQNPPPTRAHRRGPVWLLPALRWVGLAGLILVVAAGALDGQQTTRNISPTLVWVYFWLVVPFASAAVGNLWRWMNPWQSLARWLNPDLPERPDIAARLGMWPATLAFLAFTWLEIVSPSGADPRTLALAAVTYTVILVAATRWLGVESGLRTFDAFHNYHRLLAAISPYRLNAPAPEPGAASTRVSATMERWGWLRGLPAIEPARGLTAFVLVMIGTVTYDGLSGSQWWGDVAGGLRDNVWLGTAALIGTVLVIGLAYLAASWATARLSAQSDITPTSVASRFAHTLVPIGLAYAFAHYFTLILIEGQLLVHNASDPFGRGWDLFGTASWRIVFWLSPTLIWLVQVAAIVVGHVAATVLAHDRALHDFGPAAAKSQYAMLVLMVALTSLGLLILAG